jgi:hypothetical protein
MLDLIKAQKSIELESNLIWETIKDGLPGEAISNRKLSYDSADFGTISQKGVIETLIQVFGARQSPNRREKRKLIFDIDKLNRLGRIYNLSIEVKVGTGVTDVTHVTDIGLDRYRIEAEGRTKKNEGQEAQDQKKENSTNNYNNNHNNNINTTSNITSEASSDRLQHTNNPSQASQVSPLIQQQAPSLVLSESKDDTSSSTALEDIVAISNTIHRIHPHSDIFRCDNCKLRGDKWDMQKHVCRLPRRKLD